MTIVTCAGLAAAVAAAVSGATITLEPGSDCAAIRIYDRDFGNALLTISMNGATIRGLDVRRVKGLRVHGGTLRAPAGMGASGVPGYAMLMRETDYVFLEDMRITQARIGLVMADSRNAVIRNNDFFDLRSDGVNIVRSSHVLVESNRMFDFHPIRTKCTYPDGTVVERISRVNCESGGGVWMDGDHPDGVQMWESVTDVRMIDNELEGDMQGLGRLGPLGTGIYRIVIDNNRMNLSFPRGISLEDCIDCQAVGNDVRSNGEGTFPVTNIYNSGATGIFCGNVVPTMNPNNPIVQPCP